MQIAASAGSVPISGEVTMIIAVAQQKCDIGKAPSAAKLAIAYGQDQKDMSVVDIDP